MGSFLSSQSQLRPPCSSATPTAGGSQWILLAPYGGGHREACNITGDSKTIAAAATSNGHRISVSLRREPPFSVRSRICLYFLPGTANRPAASSTVIAAHGGSVLLRITSTEDIYGSPYAYDYFVYSNVIAAAADLAPAPARPPSLYLLPGPWGLDICATGLLRHGEAEFVVAELKIVGSKDHAASAAASPVAFELRLLRHGKWSVKRPWIIHGHGIRKYRRQLRARWETIAVVPLGNRMLCWVDRYSGVIFSDVLDEGPNSLRYVPYPADSGPVYTNVRGELKLVSMSRYRCSHCGCSEHPTAIDVWALNTDAMAWVLETETNMVDSTELWMLPYRSGYARTHLVYPVASINGGSDHDGVSAESAEAIDEVDEHMMLSVSTPTARASLHGRLLQGSNGENSASTRDPQQGDNGPAATVGRWPKRRRRANSMVTGPEWIA